jgi:hypothetical protein
VSFEPLEVLGKLDRPGRVFLDVGLPEGDVHEVVIHELCHALDHQERLMKRSPIEAFDALADVLDELEYQADTRAQRPARHRGETLALLCEQDLLVSAAAAGSDCAHDTTVAVALSWVHEHVWREVDIAVQEVPLGARVFTPVLGDVPDELTVRSTEDPETLKLVLGSQGPAKSRETVELWVDRWTGARVEEHPAARPSSHDVPAGHPEGAITLGLPDGPAWALGISNPSPWYQPFARSYVFVDGTWAVDPRCVLDEHDVFDVVEHHGEVLYAWTDGHTVSWAALEL